jgi:hypothetical protein
MWEWVAVLCGIVVLILISQHKLLSMPTEAFYCGGSSGSGSGSGNIDNYYQQHSRYPAGAWWIPYSDPAQACHLKARTQCHDKFCYDSCYEKVLNSCPPPKPDPWGVVSYHVPKRGSCPNSPPYPQYLN